MQDNFLNNYIVATKSCNLYKVAVTLNDHGWFSLEGLDEVHDWSFVSDLQ